MSEVLTAEHVGTIAPPSLPTATTRTKAETIKALSAPIDKRHLRQLQKKTKTGSISLDFYPWAVLTKCLHARTDSWDWRLLEVKTLNEWIVVSGRLTIHCSNGDLIYEAVSSEPIATPGAPPIETAASSCIRRACALCGLGTSLWLD